MGHRHYQHHSRSEGDEDELVRSSSSTSISTSSSPPPPTLRKLSSPTVIDELFEHLASLLTQLESAVELSSSLHAQHAAAQSTIDALESKVTFLQSLLSSSSPSLLPPPPEKITTAPRHPYVNAHRLDKVSRRPMVLCARRMGIRARATHFCTGRMGVESAGCGGYAWEYGCEV